MNRFKTVGIFSRQDGALIGRTLAQLAHILQARGLNIMASGFTAECLGLPEQTPDSIAANADLAIVVGGDGTLLTAGRLLAPYHVPVIGVNLGRLGFLVDVSPDDMENQLNNMLDGDYLEEERCLLQASAWRGKQHLGQNIALNDVVLHSRNEVRMIEFTTYIDGHFVNSQRADGLVVSTPTGSTAYALSSGGPILHPGLDAAVLVPISPHTLSSRPLVVCIRSEIEILLNNERPVDSRLSFDGHHNIELLSGDRIHIQALPEKLLLLHPHSYDYYHILRSKLHWGT